jgi:hypothetical protein
MCLSRLLDDVIETEKCGTETMKKLEIAHTRSGKEDASLCDRKVVHLRGVVPFEVLRWRTKRNLVNY